MLESKKISYLYEIKGIVRFFCVYDTGLEIICRSNWSTDFSTKHYQEGSIFKAKIRKKLTHIKGYFVDFNGHSALLPSNEIGSKNIGELVNIQIKREPTDVKFGLATNRLIIRHGRTLVFVKDISLGRVSIVFSKKIDDGIKKLWKKRFSGLFSDLKIDGKVIIRSSAVWITADQLAVDIRVGLIIRYWINQRLLEDAPGLIWSDNYMHEMMVHETAGGGAINTNIQENLNMDIKPLNKEKTNFLLKKMSSGFERIISLRRGGQIFIDSSEMGWCIDINSGSGMSDTHFQINMQAVRVIFEQIFLRNMNGLIIIDFINLKSEVEKILLEEEVRKYMLVDKLIQRLEGIDCNYMAIITRQNIGEAICRSGKELVDIFIKTRQAAIQKQYKYLAISSAMFNRRLSKGSYLIRLCQELAASDMQLQIKDDLELDKDYAFLKK